jgi:hypothetical protein
LCSVRLLHASYWISDIYFKHFHADSYFKNLLPSVDLHFLSSWISTVLILLWSHVHCHSAGSTLKSWQPLRKSGSFLLLWRRKIITVFKKFSHWALSWSSWIHPVPLTSILIFYCSLVSLVTSSLEVFQPNFIYFHSLYACYIPRPSHPRFNRPNKAVIAQSV